MTRGGALLLAALLAAPLAGCARSDPVNPNLLAPKLLVDLPVQGGPVVYVHSAFGERAYDRIELALDNRTVETVDFAYSLEREVNATSFFLEVKARSGESRFGFRGAIDLDRERDRAFVTTLSENGEWSEVRPYGLPFERILSRGESA